MGYLVDGAVLLTPYFCIPKVHFIYSSIFTTGNIVLLNFGAVNRRRGRQGTRWLHMGRNQYADSGRYNGSSLSDFWYGGSLRIGTTFFVAPWMDVLCFIATQLTDHF
jgi:hypothetical protein